MMGGSLAERLRVLRARHGYTLAEAAQKTGVDRGTLSSLERGVHAPYTPTLSKIAKGYGVPVEELLDGETEDSPKPSTPRESGLPLSKEQEIEQLFDKAQERMIAACGGHIPLELEEALGALDELRSRVAEERKMPQMLEIEGENQE